MIGDPTVPPQSPLELLFAGDLVLDLTWPDLDDLEQCALDAGLSPEKAAAQAREQIGDQEQIVQATLARPEAAGRLLRATSCLWSLPACSV